MSPIVVYVNNASSVNPYFVTLSYTVPTFLYQFVIQYAGSPVNGLTIVSDTGLNGSTDGLAKYTVTFPNSTTTYTVQLSDGSGIIYNLTFNISNSSGSIPCITAGQRIKTPEGYKLIEELKTGDLIVTSDYREVKATVYKFVKHNVDEETAPVVIPANLFYQSYPPRGITLSPYHKIQVREGEWITPKRLLLFHYNSTIKQINIGESVTYYHVKTPNFNKDHLVVEGCIIESYKEGDF
jgi:hypothetical protein